MKSLNEVRLIGNVGSSPVIQLTPAGYKVARFSLATDEEWRNTASGKLRKKPRGTLLWHGRSLPMWQRSIAHGAVWFLWVGNWKRRNTPMRKETGAWPRKWWRTKLLLSMRQSG